MWRGSGEAEVKQGTISVAASLLAVTELKHGTISVAASLLAAVVTAAMRALRRNVGLAERLVAIYIVDRPTQLIHIGIYICQHTSTKDIAGQSAGVAQPAGALEPDCEEMERE